MSDLVERRTRLVAPRCRDACILFRLVEILCVGVPEPRPIARLSRQPQEEPFEVSQGRIARGFAETFTGASAGLFVQPPLEGDRLLDVEGPKIAIPCRGLEARNCHGGGVNARFALTFGFFQEVKYLRLIPSFSGLWFVMSFTPA
jgi:hypothetical protein